MTLSKIIQDYVLMHFCDNLVLGMKTYPNSTKNPRKNT